MRALVVGLVALALPLAAAAQERIDRPGTVAHASARTGFAERVGEFRRVNVIRFDAEGENLSASYSLDRPEGRIALTVYVYPSPRLAAGPGSGETDTAAQAMLCAQEFEGVQQAIAQRHGAIRRIEAGPPEAPAGADPALSHRAAFQFSTEFDGGMQEVRSDARLYCFVGDRWQVKYRITAPIAVHAEPAVDAFVRQGPWPGRMPPPSPDETVARTSRHARAP